MDDYIQHYGIKGMIGKILKNRKAWLFLAYYIKNENFIVHHGVKGQRWGVRRYQNADGTLTDAGKRKKVRDERKKTLQNRSIISDKELNKSVNRLRKERELKNLSSNIGGSTKAKNSISKFISKNGSTILSGIAIGAGMYGAKILIGKIAGKKVAGEIIKRWFIILEMKNF